MSSSVVVVENSLVKVAASLASYYSQFCFIRTARGEPGVIRVWGRKGHQLPALLLLLPLLLLPLLLPQLHLLFHVAQALLNT